jgi:hypothetical protein
VSFSPTCHSKSRKYLASYRFVRLISDLCRPQISRPTPEDFFNAFMDHHAEAGIRVSKDTVIKLMLEHAPWLADQGKQIVDIKAWKEFARTKFLDVDEEWDVEMDVLEDENLVRPLPGSPAILTPSPKRKRVRPCARPQTYYLLNVLSHSHRASIPSPLSNTLQTISYLDANPNANPVRNVHHLRPLLTPTSQCVYPRHSASHLEFRMISTGGARLRDVITTSIF